MYWGWLEPVAVEAGVFGFADLESENGADPCQRFADENLGAASCLWGGFAVLSVQSNYDLGSTVNAGLCWFPRWLPPCDLLSARPVG